MHVWRSEAGQAMLIPPWRVRPQELLHLGQTPQLSQWDVEQIYPGGVVKWVLEAAVKNGDIVVSHHEGYRDIEGCIEAKQLLGQEVRRWGTFGRHAECRPISLRVFVGVPVFYKC